jgi:hypothetical protein
MAIDTGRGNITSSLRDEECPVWWSPLSVIDLFDARKNLISRTLSTTSRRSLHRAANQFKSNPTLLQKFRYKPLPTPSSIRLLQVLELRSPDEIRCSLHVKHVKNEPWYNCLSYTWGNPLPTESNKRDRASITWKERNYSIICNNKTLRITKSLRDALWELSKDRAHSSKLHRIWIDAICIDQENIPERNAQVLRMHDIYRLAQSAIVWLGPATECLSRAIRVMENVALLRPEQFDRACRFHPNQEEPYKRLGIQKISPEDWQACNSFLARSWFGRAWIFPEAVVARDLLVKCGQVELSWDIIAHTSWFLYISQWDTKIGTEESSY